MKFTSLSLAFTALILYVNGSDVYLHTGEPYTNLQLGLLSILQKKAASLANVPISTMMTIVLYLQSICTSAEKTRWKATLRAEPDEDPYGWRLQKRQTMGTESITVSGSIQPTKRRMFVSRKKLSLPPSCKMVSVLGAVRSKADLSGQRPFCTDIHDTNKDDPAGYGSFWITQVRLIKYLR
jgi:hypothetical protein